MKLYGNHLRASVSAPPMMPRSIAGWCRLVSREERAPSTIAAVRCLSTFAQHAACQGRVTPTGTGHAPDEQCLGELLDETVHRELRQAWAP